MREIIFRGKRIDTDEWVYGHYFKSPLTQENINCDPKHGWFFLSGETRYCIEREHVVYEIDPETLGEFTGVEDNNNTKIFEGDKCRVWGGEYHQGVYEIDFEGNVVFSNGEFTIKDKNDCHYNFGYIENIKIIP